ncbi:AAA family ATPase [Dethiobacter alkaliphilus]|uniref:ATPase associated with various cellular activities AAA_5 n=1 Tax=Dethiobacter alkaliphilus AHT 1 TaxID=555088 RepID=C0GF65_DETAL|nr:MoxR family ATPase [Dethiobacter alkaliphilus]EEG77825.1 ATPase associated with various cellular activities AAA_5 [Dethiobacter alkaliphilus AHT 1]MCW3488657.1 MoxR family ATPase [Dethiobacter alkaliphilus]
MDVSIADLRKAFEEVGYITDEQVIITVYLSLKLEKPLLIEGAPGVGKTELAKVLSQVFATDLIRLQCYEGLDENKALYEWNYQRQLLKIQISKETACTEDLEQDLFSREYLLERPLLKAIQAEEKPVLLIDEIDKTDEEFEAFLFEVLSDFQVSVPELGTLTANRIPMVVLTSNNERELSDGLKRRCVYLYLDYPSVEREIDIIQARVPQCGEKLAHEIARAVSLVRNEQEIKKKPSIAETLDWTRALLAMDKDRLNKNGVEQTLNMVLKTKGDMEAFEKKIGAERLAEYARSDKD